MRQAVVLIHGIGEQKPMGTVRRFVKAILPAEERDKPTYWSSPDKMSQSFELRRLRSRGRSGADFYEYYWAYNLQGTKLWDLGRWLLGLVARSWKDVPVAARSLWLVSRGLLLVIVAALLLGWGAEWTAWYKEVTKIGVVSLLVSGVLLIVQFFLINYLGDAARYLSPVPRNIRLRQKIRGEGIALLRALHACDEYDRIIIVGHSLGSIIAYDAITHLWQEFHGTLSALEEPQVQEEVRRSMESREAVQPIIREKLVEKAKALRENDVDENNVPLTEFRATQVAAWREQRHLGNGWKITDLITLGSPLAHAPLLMAASMQDFGARKDERELPTCPPQRDKKGFAYSGTTADVGQAKKFTPLVLHHAAPFAVTRWTNLYFPAAFGLFGDFVGGPLQPHFGLGIKDIKVSTSKWRGLAGRMPLAHMSYWLPEDRVKAENHVGPLPSLYALIQTLDQSGLRRFRTPGAVHAQTPKPATPTSEPEPDESNED